MRPPLADEATVTFPDLVAPLLVATVAATGLWILLLPDGARRFGSSREPAARARVEGRHGPTGWPP
jgi:hypothetical protein